MRKATCGGADRGAPRRLVKLNPRTGEMKEWLTPHPKNDIHEILINPTDGMVWLPEHTEGGGRQLHQWVQPEDREMGCRPRR